MEPSDYTTLPCSPSALKPMDCSGFASLPVYEELNLLLPDTAVPAYFYNVGDLSSSNPQVSSDFDCLMSRSADFPFDPSVYVTDLDFFGGELDFRVQENVPKDVVFMDNQNVHGSKDVIFMDTQNVVFDGLVKPNPTPTVPVQKTKLDGKHETSNILSSREDKAPEIATVPVDIIHNKRPFKCMHLGCDKTFKNPQTLKMHHKTHYKQMNDCPAPKSSKSGHNKKIPCRCPVCAQTFVGLYELRRHFGRKHSEGDKMHDCKKCGKKFYIEVDMRDHQKLCGERVGCKCGLKFAFKCSLSDHKRTHPECVEELTVPTYARSVSKAPRSKASSLGLMGVKLEDIWGLGCRSRSSTMARGTSKKLML